MPQTQSTTLHVDDYSSDEDDHLLTDDRSNTAKRARIGGGGSQHEPLVDLPPTSWISPVATRLANWVAKRKSDFHQTYFYRKITGGLSSDVTVSDVGDDDDADDDDDDILSVMAEGNSRSTASTSHAGGWTRRQPMFASSESSKYALANGFDGKNPTIKSLNHSSRSRRFLSSERNLRGHQLLSSSGSVHEKLFNGSSSNKKLNLQNSSVYDNIRLDERDRYRSLLQQYTCVQLEPPVVNDTPLDHFLPRRRSSIPRQTLDASYSSALKERLGFASNVVSSRPKPESNRYSPRRPASLSPSTSVRLATVTDEIVWSLNSRPEVEVVQVLSHDVRPKTVTSERLSCMSPNSTCKKTSVVLRQLSPVETIDDDDDDDEVVQVPVDYVEPKRKPGVQKQFSERMNQCQYLDAKWLADRKTQYRSKDESYRKQITAYEEKIKKVEKRQNDELEKRLGEALRFEDIAEDEEGEAEERDALPALSADMLDRIDRALVPTPSNEVLSEGFNLSIRRKDMETLANINWLNDEVINFYFNLLMERGRQDNFPSIHVCNTFFYTKLMSGGHTALKRWTRKIDIFANEMMLVPVHLGVHWCLAVVDFGNKKVEYYDSMGGSNNACLTGLLNYLKAEYKDKKGSELDTSDWTQENCKDNPRQLNGSDCGMFTCKYAEYISRRAKITFTQTDMPYFRKRMVYEILTKQLL